MHRSTRSMAKKTGLSQSTVSRVWRAFGLQPHRFESFKLSTDPFFADKVHDVVGLYLDPSERALVLCVDEKSQIQALDRSQPVLPMMPGVPERATHDYVRAGTTTLFAAFDAASGEVIGSLHRRHRATEFKKFLTKLDKEIPDDLEVHLVCDNYATHKTADIKKWLLAHPGPSHSSGPRQPIRSSSHSPRTANELLTQDTRACLSGPAVRSSCS